MKVLLSVICLFAAVAVNAQGRNTFEVNLNGKMIVSKHTLPETEGPVVELNAKQLVAGGKFNFVINVLDSFVNWKRKITINDLQDNELKFTERNYSSGNYEWNVSSLATLLKKYKTLKIYTIGTPIDEKQASLIRVRRYHLVTLQLKD